MDTHPRVLIVDDEASLRRQLMVGLAQHGYEVEECEEGLPALTKVKTARSAHHPYACVILDVRLPDIDGLKILAILKATYPDLPVVVITGYGSEDTVNTVQSRDGSAYLDKPFEMDALVSELDRIGVQEEEKPRTLPAPEPKELASAFVLIRGSKEADLSEIYSQLCYGDGVCYCDPVVGDWDLVLLIQASNRQEIDALTGHHLESVRHVQAFEVHHCEKPRISKEFEEFIRDYEKAQAMDRTSGDGMDSRSVRMSAAYAILDVNPSMLVNLYMKLYFADNVVHCDVTDSGKQVFLLLQGISAQEIQSAIRNEIRLMPGVLRIKQLNALNFSTK